MEGYNEEAAEQVEKAIKNLNVWKNCVEYLYERDSYDKKELKFADNLMVTGRKILINGLIPLVELIIG